MKDKGWGQMPISSAHRKKNREKAFKELYLRNYAPRASSACGPGVDYKIPDFKLMP